MTGERPDPALVERTRQIGEVATRVGLSPRTVRSHEEVGLERPSGRTDGGLRPYTDADVARLRWVRVIKPLGFTLDQMRDLPEARDRVAAGRPATPRRPGPHASLAAERCERLRMQRDQAERFAADLTAKARRRRS
jgi:DNA-binding transcriptional MerR regulator